MGAGKSSTGKKLASKIGWNFIDSDAEIENQTGKSIEQIFDESGEDEFRKLEKEWIQNLDREASIVALGGGTPCFNDLDKILLAKGLCIWLDAPVGMLASRLENAKQDRPLISGLTRDELEERLTSLMAKREPIYSKAHMIVQVSKIKVEELSSYLRLVIEGKL